MLCKNLLHEETNLSQVSKTGRDGLQQVWGGVGQRGRTQKCLLCACFTPRHHAAILFMAHSVTQ